MNPFAPTPTLLYLDARGLAAWRPGRGGLRFLGRYRHGEAGDAQDLCEVLGRWSNAPVRLLVETIEEDFRTADVPHVLGTGRQRLRARALERIFPQASYRRYENQGRRGSGRRDDILLLSALERSEMLGFWLEALSRAAVPLEGLYTSGYLLAAAGDRMGLPRKGAILVSLALAAGLRQVYLLDGYLRFSRLVLDAEGETRERGLVERERGRIEVFLRNQQQLPRGAAMEHRTFGVPAAPSAASTADPEVLDDRIMGKLGLPASPADGTVGDQLLLTLLARHRGGPVYSLPQQEARAGDVLRWRRAINSATLAGVAVTAVLVGRYGLDAREASRVLDATRAQQQLLERQLVQLRQRFPATEVRAEVIRAVVDLDEAMAERAPRPEALLRMVAGALGEGSGLRLESLAWRVVQESEQTPGRGLGSGLAASGGNGLLARVGLEHQTPRTQLELAGTLETAQGPGDLRELVLRFETLIERLQAAGLEVEVLDRPLDIGAGAQLRLDAGTLEDPKRDFALRLRPAVGDQP